MPQVGSKRGSTRQRLLLLASGLVFFSILVVGTSLYQIVSLGQSLQSMREVDLPLTKLLSQLEADSSLMVKELEKRFGYERWGDPKFRPQNLPRWLEELVGSQVRRLAALQESEGFSSTLGELWPAWSQWGASVSPQFDDLVRQTRALYETMAAGDERRAQELYPAWKLKLLAWSEFVRGGVREAQDVSQRSFALAEAKLSDLKAVLKGTLLVILLLSTGLIALSERALRPLSTLTAWIEEVTRLGLKKVNHERLTEISARNDETGALATAFGALTRSLLEREVTVESQKHRLEEQNRKLGEMVELQKRLSWAENLAALGKLSAQVAHEVRNPLHSIGLETEVALGELDAKHTEAVAESLRAILASVERLEKITQNYLQFARLGSGVIREVVLSDVLRSVLSTYAPDAAGAGVKVDLLLGDQAEQLVRADRDLLEGVLGNLHKNALQAAREQPEGERVVRWTMRGLESGSCLLCVEDSGPGVPEHVRATIFDPFVTTKANGTGLGLSIVQMGMEKMGGRVELETSHVLGGAAFHLVFETASVENVEAKNMIGDMHGSHSLSG